MMKFIITDGIYEMERDQGYWKVFELTTDAALGVRMPGRGSDSHHTMILSSVEMVGKVLVRVNNLYGHTLFELAVLKAAANGTTKRLHPTATRLIPPAFIEDPI